MKNTSRINTTSISGVRLMMVLRRAGAASLAGHGVSLADELDGTGIRLSLCSRGVC